MEQRIIMKRIDQILSHPVFREQFALLQEAEKADVTLVTYGIATEGTNVKSWQSLFLVASINDAKNTEQIVGRIRRTDNKKKEAYVFDYYSNDVWGTRRHKDTRRRRYLDLGFTVKEV